eukprot:3711186-Prymnesium_polylepis.1
MTRTWCAHSPPPVEWISWAPAPLPAARGPHSRCESADHCRRRRQAAQAAPPCQEAPGLSNHAPLSPSRSHRRSATGVRPHRVELRAATLGCDDADARSRRAILENLVASCARLKDCSEWCTALAGDLRALDCLPSFAHETQAIRVLTKREVKADGAGSCRRAYCTPLVRAWGHGLRRVVLPEHLIRRSGHDRRDCAASPRALPPLDPLGSIARGCVACGGAWRRGAGLDSGLRCQMLEQLLARAEAQPFELKQQLHMLLPENMRHARDADGTCGCAIVATQQVDVE